MLTLLCSVLALTAACAQDVDPALLEHLFGKPSNSNVGSGEMNEGQVTCPRFKVDRCQCVPYYFCNSNNARTLDDPTLTGYGVLDVRFGETDSCQESVERCCETENINMNVRLPQPDPSRLKGCGYRNPRGLDFSIEFTNNEAQFGEFPWVVALLDPANNTYYGAGVLIHPQVVMTGAYVVRRLTSGQLKVRAGEWDTRTTKERLQSQERLVDEILVREDFDAFFLHNNIALLRLTTPVELSDHINVICLPDQDESFDDYRNCVANGWEKDFFGGQEDRVILKRIELNMVPNPTCNSQLQQTRLGRRFMLHSSFVCAGGDAGSDTCLKDGGTTLACPVGNDRYKLAGLGAWSLGYGREGVLAVYARVASFRTWVDDKLRSWGFDTAGYHI